MEESDESTVIVRDTTDNFDKHVEVRKCKKSVISPPEFLICICSSPEVVTSESGGSATGPLVVNNLLVVKGESAVDIVKITSRHVDTTVTCYFKEGVVSAVVNNVITLATNVGDGGYRYFI